MFGKNEIVGKKYFGDAHGRLLITSMFTTLQGEGLFQGQPAIFVRLAKCNLACGFCDTFFDAGDWFTVEELCNKIDGMANMQYPDEPERIGVVITGGEPMLQDALAFLTHCLAGRYKFVQIESNGTLLQPIADTTVLCVSPKCIEQDGKPIRYTAPNRSAIIRADFLKFVVSSDEASPYHRVPEWVFEWHRSTKRPVFISPMNVYERLPAKAERLTTSGLLKVSDIAVRTAEEVISFWEQGLLNMAANKANHEYAGEYALANGFQLTLQQHLYCSKA